MSATRDPAGWCCRDTVALGIVTVVAILLRLAAQRTLGGPLESDPLSYITMARNLFDGRGIVDQYGQVAYMNAGYPIFLAGVWEIFGASLEVAKISSLILTAITLFSIYMTSIILFKSRSAAIISSACWAIFFESINAAAYFYKENLMCPLMAGMILLVVLHRTSNHKGLVAAVLGVAIGIQAIVGNAGLAVVPVLLWQVYSQYPAKSSAIYHAGILVAAILLGAGPWMARNNALLGHPVLNTNFGFNLYIGNNSNATGSPSISFLSSP